MDYTSIMNALSALARINKVTPKQLAEAFCDRGENQKFFDEMMQHQKNIDGQKA